MGPEFSFSAVINFEGDCTESRLFDFCNGVETGLQKNIRIGRKMQTSFFFCGCIYCIYEKCVAMLYWYTLHVRYR